MQNAVRVWQLLGLPPGHPAAADLAAPAAFCAASWRRQLAPPALCIWAPGPKEPAGARPFTSIRHSSFLIAAAVRAFCSSPLTPLPKPRQRLQLASLRIAGGLGISNAGSNSGQHADYGGGPLSRSRSWAVGWAPSASRCTTQVCQPAAQRGPGRGLLLQRGRPGQAAGLAEVGDAAGRRAGGRLRFTGACPCGSGLAGPEGAARPAVATTTDLDCPALRP